MRSRALALLALTMVACGSTAPPPGPSTTHDRPVDSSDPDALWFEQATGPLAGTEEETARSLEKQLRREAVRSCLARVLDPGELARHEAVLDATFVEQADRYVALTEARDRHVTSDRQLALDLRIVLDSRRLRSDLVRERRRAPWLAIELKHADANKQGHPADARRIYKQIFDLAGPATRDFREKARDAYAESAARELTAIALAGNKPGTRVFVPPLAELSKDATARAFLTLVEEQVERAIQAQDGAVQKAGQVSQARMRVIPSLEQDVRLEVEDQSRPGVSVGSVRFPLLVEPAREDALAASPIGLELSLEALKAGAPIRLVEGAELTTGDRVRIRARANRQAFLYAYLSSTTGEFQQLYPDTEKIFPVLAAQGVVTRNPVEAGVEVLIPGMPQDADAWFPLQGAASRDTVYVLAALEPLGDLNEEAIRAFASGTDVDDAAAASAHRERLLGRGVAVRWVTFDQR